MTCLLVLSVLCGCLFNCESTNEARRVFIVRHGKKEDGYKDKVNFGVKLHEDADEQIGVVRKLFNDKGQTFGKVISSPFWRTRQTAAKLVPDAEILIDPGLCECLEHWAGLKGQLDIYVKSEDPSVIVSQLEAFKPQIEELLGAQKHVPLLRVADLQPESDSGCKRLAHVAWELKKRHDLFQDGPVVLVSHGSPVFCMTEALQDSSNSIIPVYDSKRLPEMASVTELVEQEDGSWSLVGSASPFKKSSGEWEVEWIAGVAAEGANHNEL